MLIKKCDHMFPKTIDLMVEVECDRLMESSVFQSLGIQLKQKCFSLEHLCTRLQLVADLVVPKEKER